MNQSFERRGIPEIKEIVCAEMMRQSPCGGYKNQIAYR